MKSGANSTASSIKKRTQTLLEHLAQRITLESTAFLELQGQVQKEQKRLEEMEKENHTAQDTYRKYHDYIQKLQSAHQAKQFRQLLTQPEAQLIPRELVPALAQVEQTTLKLDQLCKRTAQELQQKLVLLEQFQVHSWAQKLSQQKNANTPFEKAALNIYKEAAKLFKNSNEKDKSSIIQAFTLAYRVSAQPKDPIAIKALQTKAQELADDKPSPWKKLTGALMVFAGLAILGLSIAGIPFTAGTSLMIGMAIGGSLLSAGGVALFYQGRHKKLGFSNALSQLTIAATNEMTPMTSINSSAAPSQQAHSDNRRQLKV